MGQLHHAILQYLGKLRRRPDLATDVAQIERLEKLAVNSWDGSHVSLMAPVAPDTWEARIALLATDALSGTIPVPFTRPVRIVGFLPTIVPTRALAGIEVVPTDADLLVQITANDERPLTQGLAQAQPGQASDFVTLRSVSIAAPRYVQRLLSSPNPQINFALRWRRAPAAVFVDCEVRIAILAQYLTEREAQIVNGR